MTTNLKLRPYQVEGANFLATTQRAILADEPGLGKTVQAITALHNLPFNTGNVLIVAPKSVMGFWRDEIKKWLHQDCLLYSNLSAKHRRQTIGRYRFTITSYTLLREIQQIQHTWDVIIYDEAHLLKSRKAKTRYLTARNFQSKGLFLLTGTPPISQGPQDIWTLLNLIDSETFSSFWRFVDEYVIAHKNTFGIEFAGFSNRKKFIKMLKPYMKRRLKTTVLDELPDKVIETIPVEMGYGQRNLYNQMLHEMLIYEEETGNFILAPNHLAVLTRLRQLLVTPEILGFDVKSGAIETLQYLVQNEEKPVIVYTPFNAAIPVIERSLEELGYITAGISGALSLELIQKRIDEFQAASSNKVALVCQVEMGVGFTATKATRAYFLGYSYESVTNKQAEDRIHRIGQTKNVIIRYFKYDDSVDEHLIHLVNKKKRLQDVLNEVEASYAKSRTN